MLDQLTGPSMEPIAGGPAKQVVVFLHGYGADGNDLIGLAPFFGQALPDAAFHSPHAPFPCEMAPMGRQWFSLAEFDPEFLRRDPATMAKVFDAMAAGAETAAPALNGFLDGLLDHHGLPPEKLALVGFSQGTMMALHVAPRRTRPPVCVLGYSGALLGASALKDALLSTPPVRLIHGEADPVVPFASMAHAERGLSAAGFTVDTLAVPGLEHGIDDTGAMKGREFVAGYLGA